MYRQVLLIITLFTVVYGCKSKNEKALTEPNTSVIKKLLADTTSWLGKDEFRGMLNRKELAKNLELDDIENGTDTFEVRLWWQASMYSPSSIWRVQITNGTQIAKRIDYYLHYPTSMVDSFITTSQVPKVGDWKNYLSDLDTSKLWAIPNFNRPDRGCTDGEILTIEVANTLQYKSVSYPCYTLFRDSSDYKPFSRFAERIMNLRDDDNYQKVSKHKY